jgi:phospholipase/lecithinase/hemolysin
MLMSRLSATTCTFAIALVCSSDSLGAPYSSLHVFGDSLSDAGHFADPDASPGSHLRFTNRIGPTYQPGEPFAPVAPMLLGRRLGIAEASLAPAVHADQPGLDFTLPGYQVPGSHHRASLGLRLQLAQDWSLQTAYSWQKSAGVVQQGAGAGLNITF